MFTKDLPQEPLVRLSTKNAQTAYSLPVKRSYLLTTNPPNIKLSPLKANLCESSLADDDSIMAVTKQIMEAA